MKILKWLRLIERERKETRQKATSANNRAGYQSIFVMMDAKIPAKRP